MVQQLHCVFLLQSVRFHIHGDVFFILKYWLNEVDTCVHFLRLNDVHNLSLLLYLACWYLHHSERQELHIYEVLGSA